ncbi:hypothetical protein B9Z55_026057 [Caenorhabditis nigoni]|uniref:EF-hand domain-containing protein n=1 Tax=Caenorhabditis nigoni TaxID=1611254 RepID=A0A2G5T1K4_9PELO|nr:hypothetical protein B9Z55_026057 [Caenorhabditis nigoni]
MSVVALITLSSIISAPIKETKNLTIDKILFTITLFQADINQDGELSAKEFSILFRMSNKLLYSEPLSALRDIAHSVHADVKNDKNEPDNCSQCVKE